MAGWSGASWLKPLPQSLREHRGCEPLLHRLCKSIAAEAAPTDIAWSIAAEPASIDSTAPLKLPGPGRVSQPKLLAWFRRPCGSGFSRDAFWTLFKSKSIEAGVVLAVQSIAAEAAPTVAFIGPPQTWVWATGCPPSVRVPIRSPRRRASRPRRRARAGRSCRRRSTRDSATERIRGGSPRTA
jgi:hypothetical protein